LGCRGVESQQALLFCKKAAKTFCIWTALVTPLWLEVVKIFAAAGGGLLFFKNELLYFGENDEG
jgi:hypothetical protein